MTVTNKLVLFTLVVCNICCLTGLQAGAMSADHLTALQIDISPELLEAADCTSMLTSIQVVND